MVIHKDFFPFNITYILQKLQGQAWINGVRPCLQRAIIDTVIDSSTTCLQLKNAAFDTHPDCYVKTNPSFCSVFWDGPGDWETNWDGLYNVFEIRQDLSPGSRYFKESAKQVLVEKYSRNELLLTSPKILKIGDTMVKCGGWYYGALSSALGGAIDDLLELVGL